MRTREENTRYLAEWRARNPEKVAAIAERRIANYPERERASRLARYQASAHEGVAYRTAYYAANRERRLAEHRAWRAANPEKDRARVAARRARKAGAEGSHTVEEWLAICEQFGNRCAYCGRTGRLERDHVIPLSLGGSDYIDNIRPACKPCNASKRDRTPAAWAGPSTVETQVPA